MNTNEFGPVTGSAVLSECGRYRYELRRTWSDGPVCGWVMLNPSTADADSDDPTIRRCMAYAHTWGYGGIVVRNLFALRATNPAVLFASSDPIGPTNDAQLLGCREEQITVCGWGAHGARRAATVHHALTQAGAALFCLDLTKSGAPRHPLYLPSVLLPVPYTVPAPIDGRWQR